MASRLPRPGAASSIRVGCQHHTNQKNSGGRRTMKSLKYVACAARPLLLVVAICATAPAPAATGTDCRNDTRVHGQPQDVADAARHLSSALSQAERAQLERPFGREAAIHWSNLPIAIVPREGLRLGDLTPSQVQSARALLDAALSACGLELLDDIRLADDELVPLDTRHIGWGSGNYYLTLIGEPSTHAPWILQVGGHHIAYNLTFNGRLPGATPLFLGTEPISFVHDGKNVAPLQRQSAAMSAVARAISPYPQAKLSGTFTDVVKGVVVIEVPGQMPKGGIDTGFPQSYPTADADRGVRYSALAPGQQALVKTALETYTALPGQALARRLVEAYESPAALADTFVGYAGTTDLSAKGSYIRIDGPRLWMEFIVQPAVAMPAELHYHALWRDKLSDYGGEISH
jgi:hypothetical protein